MKTTQKVHWFLNSCGKHLPQTFGKRVPAIKPNSKKAIVNIKQVVKGLACDLLLMFYLNRFVFEVLSELLFSHGLHPHTSTDNAALLLKMVSKI